MRIAIIGAGLSGLACAASLDEHGHEVVVFDKGRGAGGRMSTRRVQIPGGTVSFDHGAQYFTAHDPGFQARLQSWSEAGLAAPWPAAGADAFVGTPSMNAPLRQLATELDVRLSQRIDILARRPDGWHLQGAGGAAGPFDAVLVALPAEQAAVLLRNVNAGFAQRAADTPSAPCWTVMAAFAQRLPVETDVLQHRGPIDWAARNSAKPGRSGPEAWVIQASPEWSATHLEDEPVAVLQALLSAFADTLDVVLPMPLSATAHRWRYARAGAAGDGLLWNADTGLGVCGDWLLGPRVECAWQSGTRLADVVLAGSR
jgi:hypothetical protein